LKTFQKTSTGQEESKLMADIKIQIKGEKESAQEFIEAWKQAEKGNVPKEPIQRLYFQDLQTLLKVLTPRRLDLLKKLYHQGPLSVRALSKYLERDYKNVHQDIQALEQAGLVSRNSAQTLSVPWGRILAEISLAA
jgi:predicted transcriptional regulator